MSLICTDTSTRLIAAYQALALSGPVPPGLLSEASDGMGRRDRLHYGHSARHYLRDQGTPRAWSTRLPSHVIVVDRVVSEDLIGGASFETRLHYRNGVFDSRPRRFSVFGEVDVINATFLKTDPDPLPASPPVLVPRFFLQ